MPYTRITEYKHLTGQQHPKTSITYEYPGGRGRPLLPDAAAGERRALQEVRGAGRRRRPTSASSAGWPPTGTTTWTRSSARRWPSTPSCAEERHRTLRPRSGRPGARRGSLVRRQSTRVLRTGRQRDYPPSSAAAQEIPVHDPACSTASSWRASSARPIAGATAGGSTCWPRPPTTATSTEDYRQVAAHGLRTVRDGLRWHLIETRPAATTGRASCRCCGPRGRPASR